jgi:hypothetical protein
MISEHEFCSSYASVWQEVTPLAHGYWNVENRLVTRRLRPLSSDVPKEMRGVVNEGAFRAFCRLRLTNADVHRSDAFAAVYNEAPGAIEYVRRLAPQTEISISDFDDACRREAAILAMRLLHVFSGSIATQLRPPFRGCGLISSCEGDLIVGNCLFEIKAGDRAFRIVDVRQLLVYSALAYASRNLTFKRIGLFNPRTGTAWIRTLDEVCLTLSGVRSVDTLSALVERFSAASNSR